MSSGRQDRLSKYRGLSRRIVSDASVSPISTSPVVVIVARRCVDGGGYSYRLCKADDPLGLTEKCFHKTPLLFTGSTSLRWGGRIDGVSENITGRFVTDTAAGTGVVGDLHTGIAVVPPGSIWAK